MKNISACLLGMNQERKEMDDSRERRELMERQVSRRGSER